MTYPCGRNALIITFNKCPSKQRKRLSLPFCLILSKDFDLEGISLCNRRHLHNKREVCLGSWKLTNIDLLYQSRRLDTKNIFLLNNIF